MRSIKHTLSIVIVITISSCASFCYLIIIWVLSPTIYRRILISETLGFKKVLIILTSFHQSNTVIYIIAPIFQSWVKLTQSYSQTCI